MSATTVFLSRLIGIYCILVSLAMAVTKEATIAIVVALVHDAPVLYILGLIVVAAGLAMVLSHNVWTGGALPVIVTLVGWLALIKGLLFLFLPPATAVGILFWGLAYEQFFYMYAAGTFILGVYMAYGGFKSK